MKTKILTMGVLLLINVLIFSSCKKEGCTSECASNYDSGAKKNDGNCKGCTDPTAKNYCSEADLDDGSCTYPANKTFLGTYSVSETCNLVATSGFTMTILAGNDDNSLILNNLADGFDNVLATVSGSIITILAKSGIIDNKLALVWDVNGGNGTISGNTLSLTYSFDDILYLNVVGLVNCSTTCTK